jgi:hypothetical protein
MPNPPKTAKNKINNFIGFSAVEFLITEFSTWRAFKDDAHSAKNYP